MFMEDIHLYTLSGVINWLYIQWTDIQLSFTITRQACVWALICVCVCVCVCVCETTRESETASGMIRYTKPAVRQQQQPCPKLVRGSWLYHVSPFLPVYGNLTV